MEACNRCGKKVNVLAMSMFNTQMICIDCEKKEIIHPDYEKAAATELSQLQDGNYNFEGIGLPSDLG